MRRLETIIVILALGFYVWFLSHFGTAQVFGYVRAVGWGLALTIALEALARAANTLGWQVALGHYGQNIGFFELFFARIAGEAVDYVTPSAQLGGQFVMAMMVRRRVEMAAGLATVIVAALCEMIGQIAFMILALLLSIRLVPVAAGMYWAIVGGFLLAIALAAGFFFVQTKNPFTFLLGAAARLPIPGIETEEYRSSAEEGDAILREFYLRHRGRLLVSSLCYLFAWSLGPVEIWFLMWILNQRASFEIALLVEALGLLIERATFLIPAKLVSQEGGKALILGMLG
ncbi:MAG TPA: lysylphosphatidylglycerol synthase domain-containing protein, partial [Candidatus Binataceae bacterium]|nr:lysylphosphatidylglycerol synthase domain-containing protein [Candidatus Binataceae bacterium]